MQDEQTIYGIYLAYVDQYLRELGEDSAAIFAAAGIADPATLQPGERIPLRTFADLLRAIAGLGKHPGIFLALGARIPLVAHGKLGWAIMTCLDAGAVVDVVERYIAIAVPAVRFTQIKQQDEVIVEFRIASAWQDMSAAAVEILIGTTSHNLGLLTGAPFFPRRASVTFAAPAHADRYRAYTRCAVDFGAEANRLVFSRAQFGLPVRTADSLSQRLMIRQCEDELKELQSEKQLVARIREIVLLHLDASPSIAWVASRLSVSERTLRRRLDEEGVNFRDLLKQIRHETAMYYLDQTDLHIQSIAFRLGYRETANFRKAFRQQSGLSPRQWRDRARDGDGKLA